MGTPAPIFSEGILCVNCWGPGQSFGPGTSPEFMSLASEGIEKGPSWVPGNGEPLNGEFTLTQRSVTPCVYRWDGNGQERWQVAFGAASTVIIGRSFGGQQMFSEITGTECVDSFENQESNFFVNGTATLFIPS